MGCGDKSGTLIDSSGTRAWDEAGRNNDVTLFVYLRRGKKLRLIYALPPNLIFEVLDKEDNRNNLIPCFDFVLC